jgi:histidinol-phosphate/aromatic aminotransferase/cobyric acid decarboxylase-like protein
MQPSRSSSSGDVIADLLARRRALEEEQGDGETGTFLFGWQCDNPFAASFLDKVRQRSEPLDRIRYTYLEDDQALSGAILAMHSGFDEQPAEAVFSGAGAMSLIFTFAAHIQSLGVREVYYLSPIYFSFHFALRLLGIRARQISTRHAFENRFRMNLPNERCVLLMSDPIWYAAQPVPDDVIEQLCEWQSRTGSTVFVDGSFQYMSWEPKVSEPTARFDPSLTFRLVSPTKSLAIAGYRFAYCLLPDSRRPDFAHIYTNIYGSSNSENLAFAPLAIEAMTDRTMTTNLTDLMRGRHRALREAGRIRSRLSPRRGFFSFEEILVELPAGYVTMGGEYFQQSRFPGYARINLLSPSLDLLRPKS